MGGCRKTTNQDKRSTLRDVEATKEQADELRQIYWHECASSNDGDRVMNAEDKLIWETKDYSEHNSDLKSPRPQFLRRQGGARG